MLVQADRLVGGSGAVLVIDDTAMPKKGTHSVGVAAQYASALGKTANCQTLVSLTLARGEVPVMVALRLFLPDSWISDRRRLEKVSGRQSLLDTRRRTNDKSMKDIAAAVQPGTAALFVLVRKVTADKVLEGLKGEGGTILKTSLDHTKEAALQAALAGVQAAIPASSS